MTQTTSPTPAKHARPHLETHNRAAGHSAVAGAAYRLGLKLTDELTGKTHDFRKRKVGEEIVRAVTVAPAGAPSWATDPQQLWNRVEASENRKDAQVARDYRVPIPRGLTDEQAGDLAVDLAEHIRDALGVPVSVGLHRDADRDALGNVKPDHLQGFHAHLYFPTRPLAVGAGAGGGEGGSDNGHGFGPKLAMLSNKRQSAEWVESFNQAWGELSNDYLAAAGLPPVFDHRSYARQGVEALPQPKMGQAATAMERKGISTARGDVLREALAMAEVHRRVRTATATAAATASLAGAPLSAIKPAVASGTTQRIPVQIPAAVPAPGRAPKRSTPRDVEPRRVRTGVRIRAGGGAVGIKTSLAQKVAAAGTSPTTEAERLALERAIEFAAILDAVLQTYSAQLKEHAHLVEQARRAQQHALELSHRIEDSRKKRERARQAARDLATMHPVRMRLSNAGFPVKDPRLAKLALAQKHDQHVQEDKRAHRTLRVQEGVAWEAVKAARAELDRRKAALHETVVNLSHENLPALQQVIGFLPEDAAGWVREATEVTLAAVDAKPDETAPEPLAAIPRTGPRPRPSTP
ncbi:MobA/MobL family protein [Luteibacter sp. 329MFSha]|uniref:MobA/MobL family protein n=1 Tax=Luteibacter sp. 329MFSha TaxID=1798239 RepID=UPI0008C558C0|nr:MobA/MobL family protein [Luteibacter sp. 329MFSha]SEV96627.1 MobA/MobL family protein [Luteibacter sp. 329MFSha]